VKAYKHLELHSVWLKVFGLGFTWEPVICLCADEDVSNWWLHRSFYVTVLFLHLRIGINYKL
jgi:hypothetical protein